MSTLLFERSLPPLRRRPGGVDAAAPDAAPASGRCGWSSATPRPLPGRRVGPRRPAPVGHLRLRPRHLGRAQLALLRGHRVASPSSRVTRSSARSPRTAPAPTASPWPPAAGWCSQPVLGLRGAGIEPPCPACQAGHVGNCGNLAFGHIRPGLQTGFCADTGGGWSTAGLVAHSSQLYAVPDDAERHRRRHGRTGRLRRARRARRAASPPVTSWRSSAQARSACCVTAALGHLASTGRCPAPSVVLVGARYAHQQRLAREFGCHRGAARRPAGPRRAAAARARCPTAARPARRPRCPEAPTWSSTAWAAPSPSPSPWPWCAPAGTVVAGRHAGQGHGRPGAAVAPRGPPGGGLRVRDRAGDRAGRCGCRTFALAFEVAAAQRTGRLVSATYPLDPLRGRRGPRRAPPDAAGPSRSHSTYGKDRLMSRRPGFVLEVDRPPHRPCSGTARGSRSRRCPRAAG